ncbi:hypothetical protein WJX77_004511 [Trebouxia sp. C0004]
MVGPGSVDHTCNICLDTLGANGGVSTLLCGHPFCRECLARWQATSQLCPVCRTDQRTLERNNGQPSLIRRTDEPEDAEGPSLATILGLLGQLALHGAEPGLSAHSDAQNGNGITFQWSSQPSFETGSAAPLQTSSAAIGELQSSVQFVMARIQSLDHCPLYWNAQISELQQALAQLDACLHGTIASPAQVIQQVQQYTDTVNAQLDEFLTQSEAREQQRQRAQVHQHYSGHPAGSSQPSAPHFASSLPSSSTPTGSVPNVSSNASSGGGWSWKGQAAPPPPPPPASAAAAGPPVQGIYEAVRNIFDQHVTSDSSLGRWGEVAHHLNELHGQMNAGASQSQDASRLLASAVNAYSAYRRATASSANP